jgi:hypothetical protein
MKTALYPHQKQAIGRVLREPTAVVVIDGAHLPKRKPVQHPCHPRRRFTDPNLVATIARNMATRGQHRVVEPCSKCNGYHLAEPRP